MDTPKTVLQETRPGAGGLERAKVLHLFLLQAFLTAAMASTGFLIGVHAAISLLLGGFIGLSVNLWLALVLLRPSASVTPGRLVGALYIGELGKYLFVMAFFAIAFKKVVFVREPHNALLMIGAFAITQLAIWIWPLMSTNIGGWTENKG